MNEVTQKLNNAIVDGKMRLKFRASSIIALLVFVLLFIGITYLVVEHIAHGNFDVLPGIVGMGGFIYVFCIMPRTQRSANYEASTTDGTFNTFRMSYKGKELTMKYTVDADGYFAFTRQGFNKGWIEYADGTEMKNITHYRVTNYVIEWLRSNKLLSTTNTNGQA